MVLSKCATIFTPGSDARLPVTSYPRLPTWADTEHSAGAFDINENDYVLQILPSL